MFAVFAESLKSRNLTESKVVIFHPIDSNGDDVSGYIAQSWSKNRHKRRMILNGDHFPEIYVFVLLHQALSAEMKHKKN